jgi:hypothetical protein
MLGATQAVLLGAAGCPRSGYAATVTSIPGLLAYWRLGVQTSIKDEEVGGRVGTYDVMPNSAPGLPADSDGATGFTGAQAGTIPNDTGLQLSEFTLSLWFTVADPARVNNILVSKDNAGFDNGDFALYTLPGGILRLSFQSDGESHLIEAPGIEADTPYHVVVTADAAGISLWRDGQLLGVHDEHTTAWTNNDNPIQLGSVFWTGIRLIGTLDEIALYGEVISDTNIIALSQFTEVPIAVDDASVIEESTTHVLGTIDLCTFVGRKNALTVQLWDGNSWEDSVATAHGTASVNADNDLQFAAGSVAGTQSDSFDYRITDANGTSGTGTISLTVQETTVGGGGDVDHLVNLFPGSSADTVTVTSMSGLQTAVNAAPPGRHILIAAGTYSGGTLNFTAQGTAANPIVVRPAGARGSVTINNSNWTIASTSTNLVFTNLYFNNGRFEVYGTRSRISRCRFRDVGRTIINWYGLNTRIDHCDISDYRATADTKYFVRYTSATTGGLLYDHNYFHDYTQSSDALDSCLFSTSSNSSSDQDIWIDHCLWKNIDNGNRIITVKNSGYVIRYCTFDNILNTFQQRQGGGWEVRSCWFENFDVTNVLLGFDDTNAGYPGPLYIGNRFVGGLSMWVCSGNYNQEGAIDSKSYHPSHDARVIGNVLDTGTIYVGRTFPDIESLYPAVNTLLQANIRNGAAATTSNGISLMHQTGTVIQAATAEEYTPAVKLAPSDVGLAAPDPFCPSGPQS